MAANRFILEVVEDGKVKVDSAGSFDGQTHKDADEILQFIKDAMGGECVRTRKEQGTLNPQQNQKKQQHRTV